MSKFKVKPEDLPFNELVAFDVKRKPTQSGNVVLLKPDQPFNLANHSDVILMRSSVYLAENRWKGSNELIDLDLIQFIDDGRFVLKFNALKRIKLYGIQPSKPASVQFDLLRYIAYYTKVEQLEIDRLELPSGFRIALKFAALQVLSIDSIRIVKQTAIDLANQMSDWRCEDRPILITAGQLAKVYTGGCFQSELFGFHSLLKLLPLSKCLFS